MDILATFQTDEALEIEGKWFPMSKTAKVRVARASNDRFNSLLRTKLEEAQIDLSLKDPETEKLANAILVDVMAETVLLGWEGFTEKGLTVPYSKSKAAEYLAVKDFRKRVQGFSDNFEAFRVKAQEAQGNA